MLIPGLFAVFMLVPAGLSAGEVLEADVTHAEGRYDLRLRARIDAPRAAVYRVITDYSNLAAINPDIVASEVVGTTPAGKPIVRTVIHVCILVFCKRVKQLQVMTHPAPYTIAAEMLAKGSNFQSGQARWELTALAPAVTELLFTQTFVPDFWVPPVIGPWLIRSKLVSEIVETTRFIEAREAAGAP